MMAYTSIEAKNSEHLQALRGLLKTAFKNPVKIFSDGESPELGPLHLPVLHTAHLTWDQRWALSKVGYKTFNGDMG